MNPFAREFGPEPSSSLECAAFLESVQIALDGEAALGSVLGLPHAEVCADCRQIALVAQRFQTCIVPAIELPSGLAERILERAIDDRRIRVRTRWVSAASLATLAAGVVIAAFLVWPNSQAKPEPSPEIVVLPPKEPSVAVANPPRFDERMAEAGTAIASISRNAKDQTVTPTKNFIPQAPLAISPEAPLDMEPAAATLAEIPQHARSGIEPVTSTTRRAVNLFLRDTGVSPSPKPKS